MAFIPLGPWLPDSAAYLNGAAMEALGCIPAQESYLPHPGLGAIASAITARAQGAVSFRDLSGNIHNFCGDATKLYKMASDGLSWADVSRLAGGAYACPSAGWWDFFQFGNIVYATNGVDAGQTYTLGTSTNFAAAAGSPPVATFCGTVRGFGVLARISTAWNRITWSAIEDVTDWVSSATTLADSQNLPDGGAIMGFVSGEYGQVFQERAITRMSFEGPPTAFRFDKVTNLLGARFERSIQSYESLTFFIADDGFYMLRGGVELTAIGAEKVDRWFETDVDANYPHRISSAIDPIRKIYVVGYVSTDGSGSPDSLLMYHWPTGKWSHARVNHEMIYSAATQSGYTLDTLDTVNASLDALVHSLDSRIWTGSGRLLLSGFNTSHQSGFFDSSNLAARIETGDILVNPGKRMLIRSARPIVEGSSVTPSLRMRGRNRMNDTLTDGSDIPQNANGVCPLGTNWRYQRAQLNIPAASVWSHARGVDELQTSVMGSN